MLNSPVATRENRWLTCGRAWLLTSSVLLAATVSAAETSDPDPWEGFNRKMFAFNDTLDRYVAKPVAQGYQAITPTAVDESVTNFFSNLGEVMVIANDLGQLKFGQAASDTTRFLVNSTIGFFGVFDVASHIGLPKHDEDFGQTLGYWGVGTGPYLVLPILGPSNVRDATGTGIGWASGLSFTDAVDTTGEKVGLYSAKLVDTRADLLSAESMITGDRYVFLRSLYMQRREFLVNDGVSSDTFDDFGDFEDDDEDWDEDWDKEPASTPAE